MDDPEADDNHTEPGHHLRERTEKRRAAAGGPKAIATRVSQVLEYISGVGLDLPIFLDAVCWGNDDLLADGKAKYERATLMHSSELPQILERWGKKSPPAKSVLRNQALSTIKTAIHTEMDDAVSELTMPDGEIEEEKLLSITQEDMVKRLKPVTGMLWEILDASTTTKDKLRNKHIHSPEKV